MVLDREKEKRILDLVKKEPRTVQEICRHVGCSWHTADRYIARLKEHHGSIEVKTFRGGTKGAMKIVYWKNPDIVHESEAQELLFNKVMAGKTKLDFSPFDIYQFVDDEKRYSFIEQQDETSGVVKQDLAGVVKKADKQLLIFSGDGSWADLVQGKERFIDIFADLARRDVSVRFITRVDFESMDKIEKLLEINKVIGKDRIEIRHCEQPIRGLVVDDDVAKFKEIKDLDDYYKKSKIKTFIFYEVYDPEWVGWLQRVFWNLFRGSIDARQRLKDLKSIKR